MPFFVIFIIIPFAEIIVFMSVSDVIGLGTALIMALITALLGGAIVRYQGIQAMMSAQENLRRGILPSKELFDGLCLVAAGATLITPGFITDAIGFSLLVPALREMMLEKMVRSGRFDVSGFGTEQSNSSSKAYSSHYGYQDPGVIDAEYETVDEDDDKDKCA